jgi:transcriptional regulator with XRE-family HTH domain
MATAVDYGLSRGGQLAFMSLGQRVRTLREGKGLSITALASEAGVPVGTLDRLEKRDSKKSQFTAQLADALGVSVDALLGGGSVSEPAPGHYAPTSSTRAGRGRLPVQEQLKARVGGYLDAMAASGPLGFVEVAQVEPNVRAVRVRGDALSPAIEDGEVLLVRSGAQCSPGSKVLIQLHDGARLCKRLLFERSDAVAVADLSTKEPSTLERSLILSIESISAVYSADSWREG